MSENGEFKKRIKFVPLNISGFGSQTHDEIWKIVDEAKQEFLEFRKFLSGMEVRSFDEKVLNWFEKWFGK